MPRKNPRVEEADEKDLEVSGPKEWAAGMPGVLHSIQPALKHMGVSRTEKRSRPLWITSEGILWKQLLMKRG